MFDMLKSTSITYLSFYHHMQPISSSHRSTIISLLAEGYSVRQIQSRTGLGKSTIGRISKEVDLENNKGGHPSKLSTRNKQSIICQITTGKLDNAVEATHFINNIISSPVTPQTVRNALKENNFRSVVKQKRPLLKKLHRQACLKFA